MIDVTKCKKCLSCIDVCPVLAIKENDGTVEIDRSICLQCGCCKSCCKTDAIVFKLQD
ncbi:MAG: 4Fe-4S binding protein [Holosporaceae bacterium]|nr:4Fe-4S binding protein [Holosporaceae bacterium]